MRNLRTSWRLAILLLVPAAMHGQGRRAPARRAPIIDMHLHARVANHYGATGIPMCAPVERMPRWDQRFPATADTTAPSPCSRPFFSPATDDAVLRQTIASMERFNVFGVLGGEPELVETRPAFCRFLRGLVEAGYGDRIMFGSDQMVWPGLIDAAVKSIDEATFLTAAQKRDIFNNNAARFLRLSEAEIARHHGRVH